VLFGAFDDDGGRKPVVVLATLPGEPHVLPLDMVAVYLAARHASPHLLGPDTPPAQIAAAARALRADAVGISISPAAERRTVSLHVRKLTRLLPDKTALWLGGGGAVGMAQDLPRVVHFASWSDLDTVLGAVRAA
jgi:methylmalonyl-CoA mutase cobalamin-binding subunit